MSKFKLTQTATEVQDILNNSLQKPTGLSKTELVGVGVNGQENIEIGENLTLANGKLSTKGDIRHGYRIITNSFYYLVYTNKDYPLTVGELTDVDDFITNSNYQELRENGCYPAVGDYKNRSTLLMFISGTTFQLSGYTGTDHQYASQNVNMPSKISIVKLF